MEIIRIALVKSPMAPEHTPVELKKKLLWYRYPPLTPSCWAACRGQLVKINTVVRVLKKAVRNRPPVCNWCNRALTGVSFAGRLRGHGTMVVARRADGPAAVMVGNAAYSCCHPFPRYFKCLWQGAGREGGYPLYILCILVARCLCCCCHLALVIFGSHIPRPKLVSARPNHPSVVAHIISSWWLKLFSRLVHPRFPLPSSPWPSPRVVDVHRRCWC